MSNKKVNEIAESIDYLSEQFHREEGTMASHNVVHALDKIAHSLWDGLRAEGFDYTIPDGLFAVAKSLNRIADAINQSKGES